MTESVTSPDVSRLFAPKAVRDTNAAWQKLLACGNIPAEQADFGLLAKQEILAALADDNTAVIAGLFYRDNDGDGAFTPGETATATVLGLPTLSGPDAGEATGYCTSYRFGPLKAGETYSVSYDVEGVAAFSTELMAKPGLNLVHLPIVPTKPLVYVVPHSHFDPEWRDTYDGYILREVPQLLDRIKLLREQPEHCFVMDEECVLRPLVDRHPEIVDELRQRVLEGAIELKGVITAGELLMPLGESMIRQMTEGDLLASSLLGITVRPKIFWNIDNYGYGFQTPQMLLKAGRPYFVIGEYVKVQPRPHKDREKQMKEVRHSNLEAWDHPDFWLEGLDGSKVLVHRSNYGTQSPGTHLPINEMLSHNSAFNFRGGDFMPAEETLPTFLREANDPEAAVKFEGAKTAWGWPILKSPAGSCQHIIATSEQFYRAIENDPDLPTIQSESWLGFWDGCYEIRARSRQISRRVECQLLTAEVVSSAATLAGLPSALEDIREAWYGLLISHHHDPQLAVMGPYEIFEVMQRNMDSGRWATRIIGRSTKFLADRIATDAQPGEPVVVFNPVAWQASSVVEIDADTTGDVRVVDHAGNEAPLQAVSDEDGNTSLAFVAGDMPGAGWRTYYVQAGQASTAATGVSVSEECIENEHVRVELADGLVQKIIEKTTGKCLFAANNTAAVNELFVWDDEGCPAQIRPYDFMNAAKLLTRSSQVERQVCVSEAGPARAAVDVSCAMEWGTFRQRIILQAGAPWVDFETHVEWYPAGEGGRRVRVAFPWAAGDAKVRRDIPFGVIDWEQTDTIIPTNSWLGLADEKETVGAAMIHDGTCSQQVRDNLMWQTLFRSVRVPGDIKDDKPDPPCGWDVSGDNALEEGASIYRQRLVVHTGTWQQAAVPQKALEFTMPMTAVAADRHGGELAGEKSDLAVEGEGLVVCAWKHSDYTDGAIVRVYNTGGQAVSGALTVGFDVACAEETDFREQHTGELTVKAGRIDLQFGPYEIKTVRLVAK